MTVDKIMTKLRAGYITHDDLQALVDTETQRCAALADSAGDKEVAKLILGSLPAKVEDAV